MGISTRKAVLCYVVLAVLGLRLMYRYAEPVSFWFSVGLVGLTGISGLIWAVTQRANTARFGQAMSLEEIRREPDPVRLAQLLRYHLGWAPGKIAAELNRWEIRNQGLPWREQDVEQIVKGIH